MMRCQCSDPECGTDHGNNKCRGAYCETLYRIDMTDETGTDFCEDCAQDAMNSGLFDAREEEA